jgi:uncharacterized membrane protein
MKLKDRFYTVASRLSEEHKQSTFLLIVILVAHGLIKFCALPFLELQGDESYSVFHSQQSLTELLHTFYNGEGNPPLYYLLLHGWIKLFGIGLASVKSLNILLSICTAFFLFKITKRTGNSWFTLFVSSCFLFSNLHFDFSHEIRAFQLVLFLTASSIYFFIVFLETGLKKWLFVLLLVNSALPYSHYNAALVPIVEFMACLFFWNTNRKQVIQLCIGFSISALIFYPQFLVFKEVIPSSKFWLGLSSWEDFNYIAYKVIGNDRGFYGMILLYGLAPILMLIGKKKQWFSESFSWRIFLFFWMMYLLPLLLNYLLAQQTPSFQLRYVLFVSFGFYLSIGYLYLHLKKGKSAFLLFFFLLIVHLIYYFEPMKRDGEGWKETALFIKSYQNEKVAVVINADYKAKDLLYYYNEAAFSAYKNYEKSLKKLKFFPIATANEISKLGNLAQYDKVLFISSHQEISDPTGQITAALESKLQFCYEVGDPVSTKVLVYSPSLKKQCEKFNFLSTVKKHFTDYYYWIVTQQKDIISGKNVLMNELNSKLLGHLFIGGEHPYTPIRKEFVSSVSRVDCSLEFVSNEAPNAVLIVSIEKNKESYKRAEYNLGDYYIQGEKQLNIRSCTLGTYPKDAVVKVYVWNPSGASLQIKKMTVLFWKK